MTRQTLLPPNRTAFEEAVDLTGAHINELPVVVATLARPWEMPVSHLPWLAWGLSVDLWDKAWDQNKTRSIAARSLPMHWAKGTQASIAGHVRIMGAEPARFIVPPATTYLMNALTAEERQDYLARFAQLRIYPFVARATYRYAHFTSQAFGRPKAFLDASCIKDVGAWSRYVRTARMWDRGVETELTIRAVTLEGVGRFHAAVFDEVVLPRKPTKAVHLDTPPVARRFLVDDFGVAQRIMRISRDVTYRYRLGRETYTTTYPKADLIDVRPEMVSERHFAQHAALHPSRLQFIHGKHLPETISWRHLYERWHIHDPDRIPEVRTRSTHLGSTRLGMPAYHAELTVRVRRSRPARAVSRFTGGHLENSDQKVIADVREAVRVSKSLRDRILLNTKTCRFPVAGDRLKLGAVQLGTYIEA